MANVKASRERLVQIIESNLKALNETNLAKIAEIVLLEKTVTALSKDEFMVKDI